MSHVLFQNHIDKSIQTWKTLYPFLSEEKLNVYINKLKLGLDQTTISMIEEQIIEEINNRYFAELPERFLNLSITCQHILLNGPRKGKPCLNFVLMMSVGCKTHNQVHLIESIQNNIQSIINDFKKVTIHGVNVWSAVEKTILNQIYSFESSKINDCLMNDNKIDIKDQKTFHVSVRYNNILNHLNNHHPVTKCYLCEKEIHCHSEYIKIITRENENECICANHINLN